MVDLGNLNLGVVVADSPLSSLETRLNALERRFGTPLRVSVDTSAATGGMQRLNTETERFSRVMNGIAIGAGLAVFGVLALGAKAAGDAIVGYNDKLDRATAALTGMTGSAAAANKEMAELLQIANATPFSFEQVEKGAIRFQNVGLSAKQAEALIIDTGNAVARFGGTSVEVDHVTLAISQIASKGHVMTQEMNQLAEAGINGFAILAQATGKSEGELRKLAETGGIASSTFLTAFHAWATQPDIASSMERQSHTFSGAMSTISDSLKLAAATGFRPFFDGIVQLANKISAFVQTPWFASFVSHVQAAMAAALDALKSFLSVLAPIGKGILSALGVDTTGLGQQISDQMAHANVPKIDASFGGPSAADTAETDRLTSAIKGADAAILQYRLNVDALSRAMQMNANAQQDVKQGFEDQIAVVQRALDEVNRLSPEEKSRNTRLSQLAIVRMQIEIDKPDTTAIDQTIKDLQEKGKHIGEGTLDGFNAEIDKVNARLHDLGQANTDALDKQIKGIQRQISVIGTDRTLERRIEDLRTLLNKPAVDTTNLNNQMVGLAAQMATNPADRAGLLAQYGNLSRQKQGLITADQQSRLGAQTELQQLEERQRIQTRMDEDRKDSLEKQLTGLQDQRQAILDANEAERKGLQERLYQLNLQKTAQEKINEAAKKQNDLDIAAAEKSKVDLLAPYNAAVKLNDEERRRLELLKAQDDLRRQQAADPLTEQIKDLNQAMKDALDPMERRGRELDRQKQAADNILQDAERQKQLDKESLDNLTARIAQEAALQAQRAKWSAAIMPGGFSPYDEPQKGATAVTTMSPLVDSLERLSKWVDTHGETVKNWFIGAGIGLAVLATVLNPLGALAVGLGVVIPLLFSNDTTRPLMIEFIKEIRDAFEALTDKIDAAKTALDKFFGVKPAPPIDPNKPGAFQVPGGQPPGTGITEANAGKSIPVLSGLGNILSNTSDEFSNFVNKIGDWLGGNGDAQKSEDSFGKKTASVFGDGGTVVANLRTVSAAFFHWLGNNGDLDQNLGNAVVNFGDTFDDGKGAQLSLTAFNTALKNAFAPGGTVDTLLGTNVPTFLRGVVTEIEGKFGASGAARTPIDDFGTFLDGKFGPGGKLDTVLGTDVPKTLDAMEKDLAARFGDTGTARSPFTGFGDFVAGLFKKGGALEGYVTAFGTVLDGAMPADIAPLQGFLASVQTAVNTIGNLFKIPSLSTFTAPPITYTSGGGGNGQGAGGGPPSGIGAPGGVSGASAGATAGLDALAPFNLPGPFNDLATMLYEKSKDGIAALLAQNTVTGNTDLQGQPQGPSPGYPGGNTILDEAHRHWRAYGECEGFVGDVMQSLGRNYFRAYDARTHAHMQGVSVRASGRTARSSSGTFPPNGACRLLGARQWLLRNASRAGTGWLAA
jgi:tape measure domain-containing protein